MELQRVNTDFARGPTTQNLVRRSLGTFPELLGEFYNINFFLTQILLLLEIFGSIPIT